MNLSEESIDTTYDKKSCLSSAQIADTQTSMRSGAIYDELTQGKVMALAGLSIFIAAIAVICVSDPDLQPAPCRKRPDRYP